MKLGIGTAQFGMDYGISNIKGQTPPGEVVKILGVAADKGIRIIDTAPLYGSSEDVLGSALPQGHGFAIVTKTPKFSGSRIGQEDLRLLEDTLLQSLARLKQQSVYGLLVHDVGDLFMEGGHGLMEKMRELKGRGLVEKIGVSVYDSEEIDRVLGEYPVDIMQLPFSVFDQRLLLNGCLRKVKEAGIEIHARSAFLQGLLLVPAGGLDPYFAPIKDRLALFHDAAVAEGLTPVQACVDMVAKQEDIDYVIVGVCSDDELREITASAVSTLGRHIDYARFSCRDIDMIDPRKWRPRGRDRALHEPADASSGMIIALLQARMSSTRLPGKVMKPILGKPMLLRQVERVRRAKGYDKLVIATSTDPSDDIIERTCMENGLECFRGQLGDVLDRFYQAALVYRPEHIVRLTGDCPVTDPEVIDRVIKFYLDGGYDYASNTIETTFPNGLDIEIFRFRCLEDAWREATLPYDREHVTPFIYKHPERYRLGVVKNQVNLSGFHWSVDNPCDFDLIARFYESLYPINPAFTTDDILALLDGDQKAIIP